MRLGEKDLSVGITVYPSTSLVMPNSDPRDNFLFTLTIDSHILAISYSGGRDDVQALATKLPQFLEVQIKMNPAECVERARRHDGIS